MLHQTLRCFGLVPRLTDHRTGGPHRRNRHLGLLAALLVWQDLAQERHQLRLLDQRQLKDVGLSRADILAELAKPVWRRR